MTFLGIDYGRNPETPEEREARYVIDRTCLTCGDTSGHAHAHPGMESKGTP